LESLDDTTMQILTKLPETAKEYFSFYHERAYTELVGVGNLKEIIAELRLAYKKYPKRQKRILSMVGVLKRGINYPLPKEISKYSHSKNVLEKLVKNSLF